MVLPGCRLGLLSSPTDCGRFMLELVAKGDELRSRDNKLGCTCDPGVPAVAKESEDGVVEPRP